MIHHFGRKISFAALLGLLLCFSFRASASHIIGADLFYNYQGSGNEYKVTLVLYGDCSGRNFPLLRSATPIIDVYNSNGFYTTLTLSLDNTQPGGQNGQDVTPVCSGQQANTSCNNPNGTILGVKRFFYTATVSLSGPDENWLFNFDGDLSGTGQQSAGRSARITNINGGGTSTMQLQAQLNNTILPNNSSPTLSTIPTPFFCNNKPASYNPGAVDPNGDSLNFELVDGLDANSGTVSYVFPYNGSNPLDVVSGSFSFNQQTGQLNFTPANQQVALVVNRIEEYRDGVLVGSCMREMNFNVTLCNNNPPTGPVTSSGGGTQIVDTATVRGCAGSGTMSFTISPTDVDGDSITVTTAGNPSGSSLTVTNNGSPNPTVNFSWNLNNVAPGTYLFFITFKDNGCPLSSKQTIAYAIIISPKPGLQFSLKKPASCAAKAIFTVTPTGNGPWTVITKQGSTTVQTHSGISGPYTDSLSPGTYTFNVTNSNGCQFDTSITIAQPPVNNTPLTVSLRKPSCTNFTNGRIVITATGPRSPFTYAIGTGAYSPSGTFTGLSPNTTYTFHIKDSNFCMKDTTLMLDNPTPVKPAILSLTRPLCYHDSTGGLTASASGGTSPYTYAVNTGNYQPSGTFTGLSPVNPVIVHVRDSNGCLRDTTVSIPDTQEIHARVSFALAPCNYFQNGSIRVTAYNSISPYTYALDGGTFSTTDTFRNLYSGTYTVRIKNSLGCIKDTTVLLPDSIKIIGSAVVSNLLCFGDSNGSVTINATNTYPPYQYSINGGALGSNNTFTNLPAGVNSFHVLDDHNCYFDTTINITQPPVIDAAPGLTHILCYNASTGQVVINASGGVSPYTYSLDGSGFGSSQTFGNLPAGTHAFSITDANSCVRSFTTVLNQPTRLSSTFQMTRPSCHGSADGSITVNGTGGVPPYEYSRSNTGYSSSNTFTGLTTGSYHFSVRDANNCTQDTTVFLDEPEAVSTEIYGHQSFCSTLANGQIILSGTGGTPAYTYAINAQPFSPNPTFFSLQAGSYTFHIKDSHGCSKDTLVRIVDSMDVHADVSIRNVSCYETPNGSVTLTGYGGQDAYAFAIDNGSYSTNSRYGTLSARTYALHIRDANGCKKDTSFLLTQPARIVPTLKVTRPDCYQRSTGEVIVNATGGYSPYQYSKDNGFDPQNQFSGLPAGSYTFSVKDDSGCVRDTTILLTQPDRLQVATVVTPNKCHDDKTGVISVTVRGGTNPYRTLLDGSLQPGLTLSGLQSGDHRLQITDANMCPIDTIVNVPQPEFLRTIVDRTMPTCETFMDGAIRMHGTGGVGGYQYQYGTSGFSTTDSFPLLREGTHSLSLKDANGCRYDTTVELTGYPHIRLKAEVTNVRCWGEASGKIVMVPTSGIQPFRYTYDTLNVDWQYNPVYDSMTAHNYHIYIEDSAHCRRDTVISVTQPDVLKIMSVVTPNDCIGEDNGGKVRAEVTGGNEPYQYLWALPGNDYMQEITSLPNGHYRLLVLDSKHCADSMEADVQYGDCCTPFVPNAFSPNGDGRNDEYLVKYKGDMKLLSFMIFNRYGQQVFSTTDPNKGWNGRFEGIDCAMDTYYYYIKILCGNKGDRPVEIKGDVTLIR